MARIQALVSVGIRGRETAIPTALRLGTGQAFPDGLHDRRGSLLRRDERNGGHELGRAERQLGALR